MANYELNVPGTLLSSLLTEQDGLAKLVEAVLNQILDAQAVEQVGAQRYERSEDRMAYRNGYRPRQLYTRIGPLTLRVPQVRDGQFSTEIFARYQRSEQALVLSLMEMVVNGVSTRKVTRITEELCGVSFSKSTVSQLCMALDGRVAAFNERELGAFPFVIVDAMYFKARDGDSIQSRAAMLVSGVNEQGNREVLGLRIGDSESEAFWLETFRWLKQRGLKEVHYVVSDDHSGLVNAAQRCFQGAIWQRCQVHFMRNVLAHTSSKHKKEMGEGLKHIFASRDPKEARKRFDELAVQMERKSPKAIDCLEQGLEDSLAVLALPSKYRKRLKSTNMQERLIQEVRRRERVIRIFPNESSALRLMGALLAEIHEEWQARRYLDMTDFYEWVAEQRSSTEDSVLSIR